MMYKNIIASFLISFLSILSTYGNPFSPSDGNVEQDQRRVEYTLVVKLINDEWRVVFEDDYSKSDVTLRRGDRIRWVVEGSDASFQFPDSRIFGDGIKVLRAGNPLVMAVSANSPTGNFPYAVFVHASMSYARGQSPPRIIVRDE
ncbi:MAG: hypothetical protein ACQEQ0_03200 [Bacteroidota bacterium]